MAIYDNVPYWEEYRNNYIGKFLKEFESHLNLSDKTITNIIDECSNIEYKEMQAVLRRYCNSQQPMDKLRTRFKSYAYKQRNNLSSISISKETKAGLDKLIKAHGFADYSDIIVHIVKRHDFEIDN